MAFADSSYIFSISETHRQPADSWQRTQIDCKAAAYLDSWDLPHREEIVSALRTTPFDSLLELGCGAGPNLFRIGRAFPDVALSGLDSNPGSIATARSFLPYETKLQVGALEAARFPDSSVDVVLTDRALIYVSEIDPVLQAIRRVARKYVVFCELHTERPLQSLGLKLVTGCRAHDYRTLLPRHGFTDVRISKIPANIWPCGGLQKLFGYTITAKCSID
jgi:ubiquinone/menaquinone biosynthesis C-methylase UbiE